MIGVAGLRSGEEHRAARLGLTGRRIILGVGLGMLALALSPPLVALSRRYVAGEALQFSLLAFGVPMSFTVGAPWLTFRRSGHVEAAPGWATRLARARSRKREPSRSVALVVVFCLVVVAWRLPQVVDAVARHSLLAGLEALTLVPVGVALFLELLYSPPFEPRSSRPLRLGLAAVAMWLSWILAYMIGFAHVGWFDAYRHVPGDGLSLFADQELTAGILWFVPFCCFVPIEAANLIGWLRGDDDPDAELRRLTSEDHRRAGADLIAEPNRLTD